jgi:hypothetical protein
MPPLFACFPVCMTFVALGILALLVLVTGMVGTGPGAATDPDHEPETRDTGGPTGPPAWWVVLLIFSAVTLSFFFLNWVGADW